MKQPKPSELKRDAKGTARMRRKMARTKRIKITINVDEESIAKLKHLSEESGVPYQNLLNQVLKAGLEQRTSSNSRLDQLEREVEKLKKRIAA